MKKKNQVYFKLGLTLLCVVLASAVFMVILFNLTGFFNVVRAFFRIISPILFGVLFAYLMNPIMQFVENGLMHLIQRYGKPEKISNRVWMRSRKNICHVVGVILALATMLAVFYLAIALVVPTFIDNLSSIVNVDTLVGYYEKITNWLHQLLSDRPQIEAWAEEKINGLYNQSVNWISNLDLRDALTSVISRVYGVVKGTLNFLLGLVIAVYMLLSKEKFLAQSKKVIVALFSEKRANRILDYGRRTNRIFSGFVLGKIIDSMIIGLICYIGMSIIRLPYPMLISVIIGVTNIIPFFGPLIGAIPSALLILLINPFQCFIFVVFILLLQQFDGNILGPRILGDSVGLSSFWILISIILFSGLFRFIGMIIGVPVFAVLYMLLSDLVKNRLEKKGRPQQTEVYAKIKSTDDIELAQKLNEIAAEQAAFHADDTDFYEDEPEIEELPDEPDAPVQADPAEPSDEQLEKMLNRLDNGG